MGQSLDPACTTSCVRVGESQVHGRGVFAACPIAEGELVMENLALPLDPAEVVPGGVLSRYCFEWPFDGDGRAIALGEASMLNHAPNNPDGERRAGARPARANLRWETDTEQDRIRFFARRDIEEGEELLIDYGEDYPWGDHARR